MCNPRRVIITAARQLAEAWEAEVSRTARLSSDVTSELAATIPFGSSLARATRAAFEAGLRSSDRWSDQGAELLLTLDAGEVRYHPADGTLRVVARLSDTVDTTVTTRLQDSGTVTGNAFGRGVGEEAAQADLAARLTAVAAEVAAAARDERTTAEDRLAGDAQSRSDRAAREQHRAAEQRRRQELDERNRARLDELRDEALLAVNSVLADAQRRAIVAYALAHGAVGLDQREGDGVIEIQFEIEG
ncbi:hypothetical protein ACFRAR_08085 [Kitasatospora sp. NPDC056651]|uniref:hypothetical protein n=1 Tax=Kitasatospora sp. NPDC056651 TaxID=3345892 RepID=UPI0036836EDC